MSWSTSKLRVKLAPWNQFKPPLKCFTDRSKAVLLLWIIYVIYVFCLSCFRVCSSTAVNGLTAWLSLSEPDFYGDLVYKLKKIVGSNNFSAQFIKIISHYKKIGYNINVLQQTACLVVNPITVGNFAFLFNCTPVGRTSDSMMVPT